MENPDDSLREFDDDDDDDDATYEPGADYDSDADEDSGADQDSDADSNVAHAADISDANTAVLNIAAAAGSSAAANSQLMRVRAKKTCPVARCHATVVSLPRHLRLCHGWSHRQSLPSVILCRVSPMCIIAQKHSAKL